MVVGTTTSIGVAVGFKSGTALGEDVIVNFAAGDGSKGTEVWATLVLHETKLIEISIKTLANLLVGFFIMKF